MPKAVLFLVLVALTLGQSPLAAAIVHVVPKEPFAVVRSGLNTYEVDFPLDMTGNGDVPFIFNNSITPLIPPVMWPVTSNSQFSIIGTGNNRFMSVVYEEPLRPATYVSALPEGTWIGPDTGTWAGGDGVLFFHVSQSVSPNLTFSESQGEFLDQFGWNLADGPTHSGITGYIGVEFEMDEAIFYGWIEVDTSFDGNIVNGHGRVGNGGHIIRWAYNSIPGEPILAGQVPEPATAALLAGIAALAAVVFIRRQRK